MLDQILWVFYFIVKKGECDFDEECLDNKACVQHQCVDPCQTQRPCGRGAICQAIAHRPVCKCPSEWGGDPHVECFQCMSKICYSK